MGWPKGVPRRGYVKKDGKPHATKGSRMGMPRDEVATHNVPIVSSKVQVVSGVSPVSSASHYEGSIHGQVGNSAITEVCPKCGYAYADGGYCPDCGWMKPIRIDPWGTHQGNAWDT